MTSAKKIIHCKTEAQAEACIKKLYSEGAEWADSVSGIETTHWASRHEKEGGICYYVYSNNTICHGRACGQGAEERAMTVEFRGSTNTKPEVSAIWDDYTYKEGSIGGAAIADIEKRMEVRAEEQAADRKRIRRHKTLAVKFGWKA